MKQIILTAILIGFITSGISAQDEKEVTDKGFKKETYLPVEA